LKTSTKPRVEFLAAIARQWQGDDPVNWHQLHHPKYVHQLIAEMIPGFADRKFR
jgi:hypothetical protein